MESPIGHLNINGTELLVLDADCNLFAGRLDIDTATTGGDFAIFNVPFPSAVTFDQLMGQSFASVDCTKEAYENPIFKPSVNYQNDYFEIRALELAVLNYSNESLQLAIKLYAPVSERDISLSVFGEICARCCPINSLDLLSRVRGPIPIRFAEYYLPMIGLPAISAGASMLDIIATLGQPDHRGGGIHAQNGMIPTWIRYTLPSCYLRFEYSEDIATEVTIMPLSDPPCDISLTVR